jgi:coatomer protein complex subunit gamma
MMEDAITAVVDFLGMQPCDGTGQIKPNSAGKPHMLHLSGVFVTGQQVLARAQIAMQEGSGVILKIAVRSDDEGVSRIVADCIQ